MRIRITTTQLKVTQNLSRKRLFFGLNNRITNLTNIAILAVTALPPVSPYRIAKAPITLNVIMHAKIFHHIIKIFIFQKIFKLEFRFSF